MWEQIQETILRVMKGTPKLKEETDVACVFAYMLIVFAANHEPDPRNPGSAHVMRRSSVHHNVLILDKVFVSVYPITETNTNPAHFRICLAEGAVTILKATELSCVGGT